MRKMKGIGTFALFCTIFGMCMGGLNFNNNAKASKENLNQNNSYEEGDKTAKAYQSTGSQQVIYAEDGDVDVTLNKDIFLNGLTVNCSTTDYVCVNMDDNYYFHLLNPYNHKVAGEMRMPYDYIERIGSERFIGYYFSNLIFHVPGTYKFQVHCIYDQLDSVYDSYIDYSQYGDTNSKNPYCYGQMITFNVVDGFYRDDPWYEWYCPYPRAADLILPYIGKYEYYNIDEELSKIYSGIAGDGRANKELYMVEGGTDEAYDKGTYTVQLKPFTGWEDDDEENPDSWTATCTFTWQIVDGTVVDDPTFTNDGVYEYTGNPIRPVLVKNADKMDIIDSTYSYTLCPATNVGTYKAIVRTKGLYIFAYGNDKSLREREKEVQYQIVDGVKLEGDLLLSATEFGYDGNEHTVTVSSTSTNDSGKWEIDTSKTTNTLTAINAGEYSVFVKPSGTAKWKDGTTGTKELKWKITKGKVSVPTLKENVTSFTYTGAALNWTNLLKDYDPDQVTITFENNKGTAISNPRDVGEYKIKFDVTNNDNYEWATLNSVTTQSFTFTITPFEVETPTMNNTVFNWDGNNHEPVLSGVTNEMTVTKNVGSAAKLYKIYISLDKYPNYVWKNDTTHQQITLEYSIVKNKLIRPTLAEGSSSFDYDAKNPSQVFNPTILNFDANYMDKTIDKSVINKPGDYVISISIKSDYKEGYEWSTTGEEVVKLTVTVNKDAIKKPSLVSQNIFYTGSQVHPELKDFDETLMNKTEDRPAIDKGDYSVTISLKDSNCIWEGETNGNDFDLTYHVTETILVKPQLDPDVTYYYTGEKVALQFKEGYEFNSKYMNITGDNVVNASADEYVATISLKDEANYKWSDNSTGSINVKFKILPKQVVAPTVVQQTSSTYTGNTITASVVGFDNKCMVYKGNYSGINVGTYNFSVGLINSNYCWVGGNTSDISFNFNINKKELVRPTIINDVFTYNGTNIEPAFNNLDENLMTVTGNRTGKISSSYNIKINLLNSNYCWVGGGTEELSFNYTINKAKVVKPVLEQEHYSYNGEIITPRFSNFDTNLMHYVVTPSSKTIGMYKVKIALNDTENSEWFDDDSNVDNEPLEFTYYIDKARIAKPTVTKNTFSYNGQVKEVGFTGFDSKFMVCNTSASLLNAGVYQASVSLIDTANTCWDDDSNSSFNFDVTIDKAIIDKPKLTINTFEYDGTAKDPKIQGFDSSIMSSLVDGYVSAGEHKITISLESNNFIWSDLTSDSFDLTFTINKKQLADVKLVKTTFDSDIKDITKELTDFDENTMSISNIEKDDSTNTYRVKVSLKDPANTSWPDGSIESRVFTWTVKNSANTSSGKTITGEYVPIIAGITGGTAGLITIIVAVVSIVRKKRILNI